jgi:hypothetical protein
MSNTFFHGLADSFFSESGRFGLVVVRLGAEFGFLDRRREDDFGFDFDRWDFM